MKLQNWSERDDIYELLSGLGYWPHVSGDSLSFGEDLPTETLALVREKFPRTVVTFTLEASRPENG